jgi:hypothetical protein
LLVVACRIVAETVRSLNDRSDSLQTHAHMFRARGQWSTRMGEVSKVLEAVRELTIYFPHTIGVASVSAQGSASGGGIV